MTDVSASPARNRYRADAAAVAALFLSLFVLFPRVLAGTAGFFRSDLSAYHRPLKWVWAHLVRSSEFPWWNPLISGGQPIAANPAYESFYPLQLFLLLPDFEYGFQLHILSHVLLAGVGMYALLRSIGFLAGTSFAVALSFQLSGPVVATMIRLPFLFAFAWMPLVVLFGRRWIRHRRVRDLALASLTMGMQMLVGEPVTVLQTMILLAGYAVCAGWDAGRTRSALRNLMLLGGAALFAGALASVQLIPGFDHASHSVRSDGFTWAASSEWSTPPQRLAEIALPALNRVLADEEGFQRISVMYGPRVEAYLPELYCGVLVVICAIVPLFRTTPRRWQLLIASSIFFAVALATVFPLYRIAWQSGLFASIRYPEKFLLGGVFPLFILAAAGFEAVLRDAASRRIAIRVSSVWIAVVLAVHIGSEPAAFTSPFASDAELAAWSLRTWTLTSLLRGAAALLIFRMMGKHGRTGVAVMVGLFVTLDLWFVAARHAPTQGDARFDPPPVASVVEDRGRVVSDAAWSDIEGRVPEWVYESDASWTIAHDSMYPYRNVRWNIASIIEEDIDATLLSQSASYNRAVLRARQRSGEWPHGLLAGSGAGALIRYELTPDADPSPVYADEIDSASRYWFAEESLVAGDEAMLTDLIARRKIGPRTAATAQKIETLSPGRVLAISESPSAIEVRVTAANHALLVAAVTRDRHWKVYVDGIPVETIPVNLVWQGIAVPPGEHAVVLRYRDPLVMTGAIVSLLTLALIIAGTSIPPLAGRVISAPRGKKRLQP